MYLQSILRILPLCIAAISLPSQGYSQNLNEGISTTLGQLGQGFAAGDVAAFSEFLDSAPTGVSGDTIGHLMYIRRHFDKAAWFFGTDAIGDISDPASLNNFSAMLVQTYDDAPDVHPTGWLDVAYQASQRAVEIAPESGAYQNNLGNVARRLGQFGVASAALGAAVEINPDEALYWANLARALEAAGDTEGAAQALARAHALVPNGMSVAFARNDLPMSAPYSEAIKRNCQVNFKCQEICPRSIIGGLMTVTCEMDNSSAQMACEAGQPYPTSYDCREELPEYGILIPGLNSGFSIAVPGFSVHVLVDGQGNVDVRGEAGVSVGPIGGYVRGDGHYSPSGGMSFDNMGGGVRVSVLPNSDAGKLVSNLGHPPAHIELENLDGEVSLNAETFNAGVISY